MVKRIPPYAFRLLSPVVLILFTVVGARAQAPKWVSHVDPSMISEIELRDGELYLASTGGLVIYDPSNGSVEQFDNTIGLPSNFLTCLVFDNAGDLWVGTDGSGLARLRFVSGGFEVRPVNATFDGLSDDRITTVTTWGDTIAYGTESGAGVVNQGFPGQRFFVGDGLPSDRVTDVLADGDRLWIATDGGIARVDFLGLVTDFSTGLPDVNARAFAMTDTALWVGTFDGVARFDEASGVWIPEGLGGDEFFSMRFDGVRLWAGSRTRVYQNDGSAWISQSLGSIYTQYSLNNNNSEIRGLQPMADGTVFVGIAEPISTLRGAHLLLLDGTNITNTRFNAPPNNPVLRLSFDTDNSLWVSSRNYGVGKLDPAGTWLNYNTAVGDTNLSNQSFNLAFIADSQGSKWMSTLSTPSSPKALDELQDGRDLNYGNDVWTHRFIGADGGDGLGSLRSVSVREDPVGNLWFLSDEEHSADGWWGMNIFNRNRTEWRQVNPLSTSNLMGAGNVSDVVFDDNGEAFVALRSFGVQRWRTGGFDQANLFNLGGDSWENIGLIGGAFSASATINALALRSDGILWVGTTNGVYKWEGAFFRHITANRGFTEGLLGNDVRDLVLDRNENLWLATELGLNRINVIDDQDILSFTTPNAWQTQLFDFFPQSVVSPLVDERCTALALHPSKSLLYVATSGGLSVLDISTLAPQETDFSNVFVFPNPIRGSRGDTELRIGNINSAVNIEVYNIEGELVHTERNVTASEDVIWDLTTETGFLAASGVYLVRISDDRGVTVRSVSLLR